MLKFIGLATQIGSFIELAITRYNALMRLGPVSAEVLAAWILTQPSFLNWHPEIDGVRVIDVETRKAAARFLAGLVCNLRAAATAAEKQG